MLSCRRIPSLRGAVCSFPERGVTPLAAAARQVREGLPCSVAGGMRPRCEGGSAKDVSQRLFDPPVGTAHVPARRLAAALGRGIIIC